MVTRVRFERTTPSFGGWCSIQLSYRATSVETTEEIRGMSIGHPSRLAESTEAAGASRLRECVPACVLHRR